MARSRRRPGKPTVRMAALFWVMLLGLVYLRHAAVPSVRPTIRAGHPTGRDSAAETEAVSPQPPLPVPHAQAAGVRARHAFIEMWSAPLPAPHAQVVGVRAPLYQARTPRRAERPRPGRRLLHLALAVAALTLAGAWLGAGAEAPSPAAGVTTSPAVAPAAERERAAIAVTAEQRLGQRVRAIGAEPNGTPLGATSRESALLTAAPSAPELTPVGTMPLDNTRAATFFTDQDGAWRGMMMAGRLGGTWTEYRLRSDTGGGSGDAPIAVSIDEYNTAAAAATAFLDPRVETVVSQLGVPVTEISAEPDTVPVRAFRGASRVRTASVVYIAQFQQGGRVGSVAVTLPASADDGGRLAVEIAREQAQTLAAADGDATPAGRASATPVAAPLLAPLATPVQPACCLAVGGEGQGG